MQMIDQEDEEGVETALLETMEASRAWLFICKIFVEDARWRSVAGADLRLAPLL